MDTLHQQIEYYRARAGEYDEWFYRLGRYDQGPELNQRWFDEAETCMRRLRSIGPVDSTLELAAGTGIWTRELLKISGSVTAIDASQEVLAINREKLGSAPNVKYEQADLFAWRPPAQFDLVSFTFWLSHVPRSHAETFLSMVHAATRPGGTVWTVDSLRASTSTAKDQSVDGTDMFQRRILNDGRTFEIVKIYYRVEELTELFRRAGFKAEVAQTPTYFVYAVASR